MIVGVDRFAQPLHSELDIVRLQMAPALDLGLVSMLRVTREVFRGECSGALRSSLEVSLRIWHAVIFTIQSVMLPEPFSVAPVPPEPAQPASDDPNDGNHHTHHV
jgi:hypothetical protein